MTDEMRSAAAESPVIVWFRDDLRLSDNPALQTAVQSGRPIICIFVYDEKSACLRPLGGAARWWLHGSLERLDEALKSRGGRLFIWAGSALTIVPNLAAKWKAAAVFWNRRYGEAERRIDEAIKNALKAQDIEARSFNGHLLYEPWSIKTRAGGPYRVFSAFWRAAREFGDPNPPLPAPLKPRFSAEPDNSGQNPTALADLALEPSSPDWASGLRSTWQRGEAGALVQLECFVEHRLANYADSRDHPDRPSTSRLSPYLRFGNISPRQIWHAVRHNTNSGAPNLIDLNLGKFQSELGWREFCYHLLYNNPDMATRNLQPKFDRMKWQDNTSAFKAWQKGRTGYPIIDAGMRELWTTGWMHNRVRMIVASFLMKNLLIDWRQGEAWFWDTLVDADPANNAAGWQWVAGSGADAAPYFRIFNPVLQGEKFDPEGNYVKRWVPELAGLSASVIHKPWQASDAEIGLGSSAGSAYPDRIVDHIQGRRRALEAYGDLD